MAIDKMVDAAKLDREMLATANAIREKGKTEATIPWEDEIGFEQAVLAIKGGGDLNFEVVGGTIQPSNPKPNTIWVNTSTEITKWVFDFAEPTEPETGMAWFLISSGSSPYSNQAFNALSENTLIVLPEKCKQYLNGAWEAMPTKSYLNGEWVNWWDGTLFDNGEQYAHATGGWRQLQASLWGHTDQGTVTIGNSIVLTTEINQSAIAGTNNPIDFSRWNNTLNITVSGMGSLPWTARICTKNTGGNLEEYAVTKLDIPNPGTYSIPIADIDGMYYVVLGLNNNRNATISRVWLE